MVYPMKTTKQILLLAIIVIVNYSCKQTESSADSLISKNTETEVKYYGISFPERDSISVNIDLNNFKSYKELLDRMEQIGCTDRIPKITLQNNGEIRKIYFQVGCNKESIKSRDVIKIYDDGVSTEFDWPGWPGYPLDSLQSMIDKNIKNFGKNDNMSSSPDKLVFDIVYPPDTDPKRLNNTLLQLTKAFDKVGGTNVLKVLLNDTFNIPPPPAPPAPPAPDIIEVVEDELEIEETVISNLEIYEDEEIVEVIEVDNTTSTKTAASTFNSLTNYMVIPGTSTSSIYLNETSTGRYKIIMTVKVNNYIENGVNNGTATIKATVPLDKVNDLYIEDDIIFLESNDDNFYIVAGFAGKEESHYTDYFEIQVKNKSKRDRIYKAIKTLVE
jgi:hypothetical protein